MEFIHALNLCPIVWVKDAAFYNVRTQTWYEKPGYEAYSIYGEIRAFGSWKSANRWRLNELKEYFDSPYRYDSAVNTSAIYF